MLLLTGATGFLGSRLCAELLRRTDEDITCLVRAESAGPADIRLRERLRRQDQDIADSGRLHVVAGDFSQPYLALDVPSYQSLAHRTRVVYHCGASVNMAAAYQDLAPANVAGTREILKFCRAAGADALHFVSSLGVFLSSRAVGLTVVSESTPPSSGTCSEIGYPRSKYEAEQLVRAASASTGLHARIYRPSLVLADSRDGACPHDDFTACLLAAVVATGAFPHTDSHLPVITADHAAQSIAALSLAGAGPDSYPVTRPTPLPVIEFARQARAFGYSVTPTTSAEWNDRLRSLGSNRAALAMRALPISRYLLGLRTDTQPPDFRVGATTALTSRLGIRSPATDHSYFSRVFTHLINSKVLPPPRSPASPRRSA
ncbi:thioester reductase domain-containing protein [Streptomyces sp. ITFR-16]|uniref:thioester reductase domain-containing protein n=1 Tax=Streptomyces sp. ITFR-16 TaxID=3075198 RepID=UPI0028895140|nr:thioester reductase domain-containing protein [Streptomyces sp. ITFR-16]WNI27195.1 thioester reductase domain-containing protein [Streptomyces sp. ITFR-16]